MDHWGDPWADGNANDDKSPTKNQIPSPLPPAQNSAPGLLNGFLDDAGWGNDESFGDWETPFSTEDSTTSAPTTDVADTKFISKDGDIPSYSNWNSGIEHENSSQNEGADWSIPLADKSDNLDAGPSKTPDSSTTVRPDDTLGSIETNIQLGTSTDDSFSAHPSISSSESSHNEAPTETPRTSIEEEHDHYKQFELIQVLEEGEEDKAKSEITKSDTKSQSVSGDAENEFKTPQKKPSWAEEDSDHTRSDRDLDRGTVGYVGRDEIARDDSLAAARREAAIAAVDQALLDQLFPDPKNKSDLEDADDDPVYSTGGRKAWYRLTRKQTLREYNIGAVDDNHIRVTWATSHIRSEVNKIVGRWAREDRTSGTGAGARMNFYWDTTGPLPPLKKHSRTRSSISKPRGFTPVRQSLPILPPGCPTAFSWSNPSASSSHQADGSVSSNIAPEAEPQSAVTEASIAPILVPPPLPRPPVSRPLSTISVKDDNAKEDMQTDPATDSVDDDDDDEWGEMVTGVEDPSSNPAESPTLLTSPNNPFSSSSSPLFSPNASLFQEQSAEPTPIVRLKSTISPTATLFGSQRFIPLHAEQGPVGPSLLKRFNRAVSDNSGKKGREVQSLLSSEPAPTAPVQRITTEAPTFSWSRKDAPQRRSLLEPISNYHVDDDDHSAIPSSPVKPLTNDNPSPPPPEQPSPINHPQPPSPTNTPQLPEQPAPPTTSNMYSWANADFSFFDAPQPSSAPTPPVPQVDPSDPFSIFETAAPPSTAIVIPEKPFIIASSTSTPHTSTPTMLPKPMVVMQPVAQPREDEDLVIQGILSGLPNLGYMLRP